MKHSIVFSAVLLMAGCGKTRFCECDITESGTVTTITAFSIPFITAVADTTKEPLVNRTTARYEFDKVSKADMRAACPVSSEEEINDRTVAASSNTVVISITTEKVGTRKKKCEVVE